MLGVFGEGGGHFTTPTGFHSRPQKLGWEAYRAEKWHEKGGRGWKRAESPWLAVRSWSCGSVSGAGGQGWQGCWLQSCWKWFQLGGHWSSFSSVGKPRKGFILNSAVCWDGFLQLKGELCLCSREVCSLIPGELPGNSCALC